MINFPDSPTNGQVFTSGSTSWIYDGTKWGLNTNVAVSNDSMPVGSILWFANTTTTPPGFIAADGSAVSRTTYATLFSVIGTTHGSGDGSTTFNVPNVAATTGKYYIRYTTALGTQTTTSLSTAPVGTMMDWPVTSSYPTGWLRADGSAVSRTSYADLFALISTTYGSGDGSTTFNLPNMVSAGSGSPVGIIKASLGGIVEPSTVAHASSHVRDGSDIIDGDRVQVDYVPSYYTRNAAASGAGAVTDLTAHLGGLSDKFGNYESAWTAWTPTISGVTVGNGNRYSKYIKIGKTVIFYFSFVLGSTSAVTGDIYFSLPFSNTTTGTFLTGGFDCGGVSYTAFAYLYSGTAYLRAVNTSGAYANQAFCSATVPGTWANGNGIYCSGVYESV